MKEIIIKYIVYIVGKILLLENNWIVEEKLIEAAFVGWNKCQ